MLIILLVIILLFGASRIPKVMKGLGEGMRSFKDGLEGRDRPAVEQGTDTATLEAQLRTSIGRLVDFQDGTLTLGVPDGKKLVSVDQGLLKLEGQGSIETVQLTAVKQVVELKA